jgi:hypothetical protein
MRQELGTMTTEETNALRIFERNTVRKICGPVKEKEGWRIRKKKEGHITRGTYCKTYKNSSVSDRMVMVKKCKTKNCQKKFQQLKWNKKRGISFKKWRDEVEEVLDIIGIKNRITVFRNRRK